jgi:dipeptidyl aminopeptidase/acylaminoacyl peptidase
MVRVVLLLLMALSIEAALPPLEQLFRRPYLWGTSPDEFRWSKEGHTLVFLWNAEGRRFMDLYAYHPDAKKLVRLTDLEKDKDELNVSEAEKDDRLRFYLQPPAGLAGFELSRDGRRAAFAYKGDLWLVDTDGSKPPVRLTHTKAVEGAPRFSPDGKKLASIRGGQIHVQDLTNGQLIQVSDAEGGTLASYTWSPDGKWFTYTLRRGQTRQLPLTNYSGRFVSARPFNRDVAGDQPSEFTLYVIPAEGGKAKQVDLGADRNRGTLQGLRWSDDGKRFVAAFFPANWKTRTLLVTDVATAKAKPVFQEKDDRWVDYGYADFSPDGKTLLFTSERDGFAHLYTLDLQAQDAKPKQITEGKWEIHSERFSDDPYWVGEHIYFNSTEVSTAERHTYRIRPDGTGKQKLSTREGLNIGVPSQDGKHMAWRYADLNNPLDLWVDGERVTKSPQPEFYKYKWPETAFVEFPARGDKAIVKAKILLPPGYKLNDRSGKKWPSVFFIHGAGYATSVLKQWGSYQDVRFAYNTYLADRGYVVVDLDYRGSTGYGRDWRSGVYLHMGGPDLDDVLGGVDYLAKLGNIDMNRLGIWGVSYGGFMTDMALFLSPGTFKAGSAWAAVNDWENYNAGYTTQRLNTPESNPEAYRRSSPIYFSQNLKDKLLIVHGMVDDNVLFQDAVQLTEKLIREGKDFAHIYYPQESHGFVRDETWIDAFRRTTEWFDRHLK